MTTTRFNLPFRPLALVLGMSILSGCSSFVRSDFEEPTVTIPAQWQTLNLGQSVSIDPWWQQFNDPQLDLLISQVLATNNDLTLATLTLQKARLSTGLSETDRWPQLSSNTSASTSKDFDHGDSSDSFSTDLGVSYEVDLWGRVSANIDQAKWAAMATQEDREATAQSLVSTTASLYWQIGYLNEQIALSKQDINDSSKILELTQLQYQAGAVSELEVVQIRRSLAAQESNLSVLQQTLAEVENAMAILFNQPPQADQTPIVNINNIKIPAINAGVPSTLLVRRPDVKAALYQLKSVLAAKDATVADYLPTLSLTGAVGDSSDELKDLLRNPIGTLGAQLALPFLQWNKMQINKQIAELDYQTAVVNYRQTLYQAFADVDNSLSANTHYQYQAGKLQIQYDSAVKAEQIYSSRYRYGAVDMIDWLDAQADRRDAQAALLENKYNQLSNQAVLYQALGGNDIAPAI